MQTAAFLSYNSIPGFTAGWQEESDHKALVIQNSKGQQFAAKYTGSAGNVAVQDEITNLWNKLSDDLAEINQVVIYVSADGSEVAIDLASKLPAEKVTYVLCDCEEGHKRDLIKRAGHSKAKVIMCECRGTSTMSRLVREFLKTGEIN